MGATQRRPDRRRTEKRGRVRQRSVTLLRRDVRACSGKIAILHGALDTSQKSCDFVRKNLVDCCARMESIGPDCSMCGPRVLLCESKPCRFGEHPVEEVVRGE